MSSIDLVWLPKDISFLSEVGVASKQH